MASFSQNNKYAPGKHILLDLFSAQNLSDISYIENALKEAALLCGATILKSEFHSFGENSGVTGVAILAESHITIHTWPENSYAALDIFMCGKCDPTLAIEPLKQAFQAKRYVLKEITRGI